MCVCGVCVCVCVRACVRACVVILAARLVLKLVNEIMFLPSSELFTGCLYTQERTEYKLSTVCHSFFSDTALVTCVIFFMCIHSIETVPLLL